ncbi:MAG: dihydrolipoyl dehydrogenase [Acidobacteria bacterium]|nr:MAG: dihydrolipoyl dehydrogenase [Acidobacteriota bacterium]
MMSSVSTKLAVVGAGPGGYAAAFYAADLGIDVTLIDPASNPGGVCLYRGCIPSKALLHAAHLIDAAQHAGALGIEFGPPRIDLNRLRGWKDTVVKRLTDGLGQVARQRRVKYVQGTASIVDPHTMIVETAEGNRTLSFERAVLATGSRPARVPGLSLQSPRVLDSTSALELSDVPRSLLVIGGGYIGLELGTVYATLGSRVTIVEMTLGLLPGADRDLVTPLARRIEHLCKSVLLETKVVSMEEDGAGIAVTLEGAGVTEPHQLFDKVLVSVGRRPNSDIPGLEATNVKLGARGFIVVDEQQRTAEPSIYAIGDVVGEPMLAHKASHEARVAVEAAFGQRSAFEPAAIPAVVFTDPELAWCGLTEQQGRAGNRPVEVTRFPWAASGRSITLDRTDGMTKLIVDSSSGRVLGVGIVGPGAGELIAEGVLAIEMGATVTDLKMTIHPHPTLSETIMESAEVFFGQSTHVYKPKKS